MTVLDRISCFSVPFCDIAVLVLKIYFQFFSFASQKLQGFSSDRKILMIMLSVFYHLQSRISDF